MKAASAALWSTSTNKTGLWMCIHDDVIYLSAEDGDTTAEVALQYNDSYNELILSFANNIHTTEGGTHEMGFKYGLNPCL